MKKYKIVICSAGKITERFINNIQSDQSFDIVGIIPDSSMDESYIHDFLDGFPSIQSMSLDSLDKADFDIIFTLEYRKLIKAEYVNRYTFINLHAGILPKYKGFSANAWAIMNGENEIGYTIHRMDSLMDSGEIYFIKKIPIKEDQTYSVVHGDMINSIIHDVPEVLKQIIDRKIDPVKQTGDVIYGMKFNREMGVISNFDVKSDYLVNLWRCMAKPLGSGIYFRRKDRLFEAGYVVHGKQRGVANYIGIPGKIVNITEGELWVKTRDNVVIFGDIAYEYGESAEIHDVFKIGNDL